MWVCFGAESGNNFTIKQGLYENNYIPILIILYTIGDRILLFCKSKF